jgi:SAM-dependent methyltransferase
MGIGVDDARQNGTSLIEGMVAVWPMATNFGAAADDYARFRAGFPESFFARLLALGVGVSAQIIVDIGTGTGTLARGFARNGCRVTGVDPDERMLDQARRLDEAASVSIDYRIGRAEAIPLPDEMADVVTAGQCWHWFDRPKAAKEFFRVVRPGGRVVVAHFDWLPLPHNVVEATERLIMKHNSKWRMAGGSGIHPESLPHLSAAGFSGFETFSYDVDVPYSPEAWRGRIRASAGIAASLPPAVVQAFDRELAELLKESFPAEVLAVPHRIFAVVGTRTATEERIT